MQIKLILTRKVLHLVPGLKVRDFGTRKWPINFIYMYVIILFNGVVSQVSCFAVLNS